ncbi:hypothetical protein AB0O76_27605 [Streptomyces sp. NPDC086554]|uniref:hypothetical protein n=1 Tax=Streptomyces sp. NPDC086554 TaxID=3154864 RepID=UPI00342791FC
MMERLRKIWKALGTVIDEHPTTSPRPVPEPKRRTHNLFEAAAAYASAHAEGDQERADEASSWVSPEALSFGVNELAGRALIVLARERGESPETVARSLLGLKATTGPAS